MNSNSSDKQALPYWPTLGGPIFLFLLALFFFARPLLLLGDGGSCRHYLTGLYILQNHGLPTTTYMSAVEPNAPWVTHELLCDLIFGLPFPLFGLNWVVLSSAVAIALGFTWCYQMARLRGSSLLLTLLGLVLAIEACTVHWSARPHLFTYLLFLATYYECFVAARSLRMRTIVLSGLMFFWGNLHGSYPLGLLMIAARGFGDCFHGLLPEAVDTGAGSVDTGAGSVDTGSGSVDTGSGSVDTGAGSVDTGAGSVDTGAGSLDTGAGSGTGVEAGGTPALPGTNGSDLVARGAPWIQYKDWSWKESGVILGCALIASCLNVRGANFLGYIIGYLTSSKIQAHSDEWRSIDFGFGAPVFSFLLLFCMLNATWVYSKVKPKFGEFLYMLFLFCVSLYAMRLIPYFALAALPAMAAQFGELRFRDKLLGVPILGKLLKSDNRASDSELQLGKQRILFPALGLVLCVVFLTVGMFKIPDFDPTRLPVRAIDYMKEHGVKGLGFTKDNWGAYLYWRSNEPIFIDDKTDFYSQKLLDDYTTIFMTNPGWQKALDTYPFKYILIPRGLPLEFLLDTNSWKKTYQDDTAVLFIKESK